MGLPGSYLKLLGCYLVLLGNYMMLLVSCLWILKVTGELPGSQEKHVGRTAQGRRTKSGGLQALSPQIAVIYMQSAPQGPRSLVPVSKIEGTDCCDSAIHLLEARFYAQVQRFVDLEATDCCYLHAIRPPRRTIPRACRQNRGDGLLDCWIFRRRRRFFPSIEDPAIQQSVSSILLTGARDRGPWGTDCM